VADRNSDDPAHESNFSSCNLLENSLGEVILRYRSKNLFTGERASRSRILNAEKQADSRRKDEHNKHKKIYLGRMKDEID